MTDIDGVQTYFLYDGLGSTTDLTDGSGSVTASYRYDVFGDIRNGSPGANEWLFTGEQRDPQLQRNFCYLRARYYDPAIGRFLARDPLPAANPYAYVGNSPVNFTDPSGLCIIDMTCPPGLDSAGDEEGASFAGNGWYWRDFRCWQGGCVGYLCYDVPANEVVGAPQTSCQEVWIPESTILDTLGELGQFAIEDVPDFLGSPCGQRILGTVLIAYATYQTGGTFAVLVLASSPTGTTLTTATVNACTTR